MTSSSSWMPRPWLRLLLLALLLVSMSHNAVVAASTDEDDDLTRQLLSAGDGLLGQGRSQYQEALAKYTAALVRRPTSHRGLASRAELAMMLRLKEMAHGDVDALLAMDPLHTQGLTLRVSLNAQMGKVEAAVKDLQKLASVYASQKKTAKQAEAQKQLKQLQAYAAEWRRLWVVLEASEEEREEELQDMTADKKRHLYEGCSDLLRDYIRDFGKDSMELRLRRASCALSAGTNDVATSELKVVLQREPNNLVAVVLNAKALRGLGALDHAKKELHRCLSLDPEYLPCASLAKLIRAQLKYATAIAKDMEANKYSAALTSIDAALAVEANPPNKDALLQWRCGAFTGLRKSSEGLVACKAALQLMDSKSPAAVDVYLHLVDLYVLEEEMEQADSMLEKAKEIDGRNSKVEEKAQKLHNLKKQAQRKDYYKILGVKKTASAQEIKRVYRRLAMRLHPDQLRSKEMSEAEREKVDRRFRDINEAKEVLLDEEKRKRYDDGEDVMNPNAGQQGGQGQPFYGQQFHFQGGGFPGGGFQFPGGGGGGGFRFPGGGGGGGGGGGFHFGW